MANPWNIVSIYELQYFNCPSCNFKNHSKQDIVTHAYEFHPESINFLTKISDDSLNDVIFPWNNLIIKEENLEEIVNEIKIEESNLYEDISDQVIVNEEIEDSNPNKNHESSSKGNTGKKKRLEKIIQLKKLSVYLTPLKQSTLENHLNVNNKSYQTNGESTNEYSNDTYTANFSCEICQKSFKNVQNLNKHIERFHVYKCVKCDKTYQNIHRLRQHNISHKFKCHKCEYFISDTAQGLKTHIFKHHENNRECYCCRRIHGVGENDRLCKLCGKCFVTSSYMIKHIELCHT